MTQLKYFFSDINRVLGKRKARIIHIWMSRIFVGIFLYRFERSLFLIFNNIYGVLRIPLIPLFYLLQAYSNIDIHYKANIKGGLLVLHPSLGIVISGQVSIGKNLTLTGGNLIGSKVNCEKGSFVIGDNCTFGGNATLIGPLVLSDNISVGASACVVNNCLQKNSILVGVPAKEV
ncbi:serine acetyltransferase [uncultured Lutibacter sp.]|uniref:serine acetyltransferase n=1 Tax=uncultured Lutibacter sp. TaxID=437739 RepID=UPI0026230C10|nr:serine acetyltransferase [uncultured Lutibacter sp.]